MVAGTAWSTPHTESDLRRGTVKLAGIYQQHPTVRSLVELRLKLTMAKSRSPDFAHGINIAVVDLRHVPSGMRSRTIGTIGGADPYKLPELAM